MIVIQNEIGKDKRVVEVNGMTVTDKGEANIVQLKPVEEFKTKDELKTYGKEFGIDLNNSKTIANMYKDLQEHTQK